jgi:competence protein ComEC
MNAAVAALIAAAEWQRQRRGAEEPPTGYVSRGRQWLVAAALGILVTTVVATIATAPYGTYHFQNLQPFGLIGNALALPLVSIVVMPCAVFGVVAYPFGLDRVAWQAMGIAVEKVLEVSAWVNGLSGSTVIVPAFGVAALGCLSVAILIVTLMVSPLRWLAAVPAALGLALAATPQRFDLYVDRSGIGAALRGRDGRLVLVGRSSAFTAEQWLKADGDARRASDPGIRAGPRCDPLGCIAEGTGRATRRARRLAPDRAAFLRRRDRHRRCVPGTARGDGDPLHRGRRDDRDRPHAGRDPPLACRRRSGAGTRAAAAPALEPALPARPRGAGPARRRAAQ